MILKHCMYKILRRTRVFGQHPHMNSKTGHMQCDAHCNTQRKATKFVLGLWVEHAIPAFTLILCYEWKVNVAILALKPQNIVWICGWVMRYLHQKGNMGCFLGVSCNTCIKPQDIIWICGRIMQYPHKKERIWSVYGWLVQYPKSIWEIYIHNYTNVFLKWILCFISLDKNIMSFNNMHRIFYWYGNTLMRG